MYQSARELPWSDEDKISKLNTMLETLWKQLMGPLRDEIMLDIGHHSYLIYALHSFLFELQDYEKNNIYLFINN